MIIKLVSLTNISASTQAKTSAQMMDLKKLVIKLITSLTSPAQLQVQNIILSLASAATEEEVQITDILVAVAKNTREQRSKSNLRRLN